MTAYPAAGDYYKAVQFPSRSFTVPRLQAAEFVWDSLGPTLARGSSAVVFQAAIEGKTQALRCYIRNDASSRERYSALGDFLAGCDLDPFVTAVTWTDSAIRVNGATWLAEADIALYEAKQFGRNRVAVGKARRPVMPQGRAGATAPTQVH